MIKENRKSGRRIRSAIIEKKRVQTKMVVKRDVENRIRSIRRKGREGIKRKKKKREREVREKKKKNFLGDRKKKK